MSRVSPDDVDDVDPGQLVFVCPNGHTARVTRDQIGGGEPIDCPGEHDQCSFEGYIAEGGLHQLGKVD